VRSPESRQKKDTSVAPVHHHDRDGEYYTARCTVVRNRLNTYVAEERESILAAVMAAGMDTALVRDSLAVE
jgi:hypothetical protein